MTYIIACSVIISKQQCPQYLTHGIEWLSLKEISVKQCVICLSALLFSAFTNMLSANYDVSYFTNILSILNFMLYKHPRYKKVRPS